MTNRIPDKRSFTPEDLEFIEGVMDEMIQSVGGMGCMAPVREPKTTVLGVDAFQIVYPENATEAEKAEIKRKFDEECMRIVEAMKPDES